MAKSKIHPQFFHTLAPDFHTHLTIPEDFFMKYVECTNIEERTVEVKSDKTWKVKMIGRSLSDGWEEFAVASNFEIGDVVLVRYEGDLVFNVLNLGPSYSEIPDITPPSINNDGKTLLKKRMYSRTQGEGSSEDEDDMEFHRKKKVKKNNVEAESFVAIVTDSNLLKDALCLPQDFTSPNGISTKCRQIVLRDERERSWVLDLAFNKSSDTLYISRGWRNFCEDNGQTAGGFFKFKLVENGETPVLSFCATGSTNDRKQGDCSVATKRESVSSGLSSEKANIERESSSMESLMDMDYKKCSTRQTTYSSFTPGHKQFITITLPHDYAKIGRLSVPSPFLRENGIDKPCSMYLLDNDGQKWPTSLLQDKKGTTRLGAGWKDFVKANGLNTGKSFTLKLIWENTTPVLSLCPAEFSIDRGAGGGCSKTKQKKSLPIESSSRKKISKVENSKEENSEEEIPSLDTSDRGKTHLRGKDSTPSNRNQVVTLKIAPSSFKMCRLCFPAQFARENNMNKHGRVIYLSRKDGTKWLTTLTRDKKGRMTLRNGWKEFAEANDLKSGDSFTVELKWEDATPILSLICPKANEKEPVSTETRSGDSSSAIQNLYVTLALTPEDVKACKLHLPSEFIKANDINKLGRIIILGENKTEWSGYLLSRDGTVALGVGWIEFCEANGVKSGESFTLEFINEQNTTPVLRFSSQEALLVI